MVFPIGTYGCESWTIKKAEHHRIDALNCAVGKDSSESLGLHGELNHPVPFKMSDMQICNNLRYAYDTTLLAESEEKLKSLLIKVRVKKLA